jgi:hypothetical protein
MKRHPVSLALAALAAALSLSAVIVARPAAAQTQTPRYTVTELKPYSTEPESYAWAINDRGLVVGHSIVRGRWSSDDQYRAVVWDPDKQYAPEALVPLPLTGHEDADAKDVNNKGPGYCRSFASGSRWRSAPFSGCAMTPPSIT